MIRQDRKRVLLVLHYYDYRHHAGVARYAAEAGWALEDAYTQLRSIPESWEGDGIISFHGPSTQFVDWLKKTGVPVVDIGEHGEYSDFPRVMTDNEKIGHLAVEHFAERGYRNVGFVWMVDNALRHRRGDALRNAAIARGMKYHDVTLDRIASLSGEKLFPLALLAVNDAVAVRTLRACEDAGILVPEQVAILGIDNFEYRCLPASVPVSSVDAAQERLGYEAAAMLDRLMKREELEQLQMRVPPEGVVLRDSTDILAVADLEVAQALRYILRHFRQPIGLREVCEATDISLRRLQTRFKEQLGRTILQEINGRRVRHAQQLLTNSNRKIRAIAGECGFGSSVKLIRVFKQYVGTSPKRYRKQIRKTEQDVVPST